MPFHALLWDLGGVIARTEDPAPRNALAERLGLTRQQLNEAVFGPPNGRNPLQLGELSLAEYHAHIATALGCAPGTVASLLAKFYSGDVLDFGLVDELRRFRQDYRLTLVSNHLPGLRQRLEDEWQIDDVFHQIVISSEVGLMKPDPAIYHLALEKTGCAAEESVFIDDHEPNVTAARDLGLHGIVFHTPAQALAELHALLKGKEM